MLSEMVKTGVGLDFIFHSIFPTHYTFWGKFHPEFIKICEQYPRKFNFGHFYSSPVKLLQKI